MCTVFHFCHSQVFCLQSLSLYWKVLMHYKTVDLDSDTKNVIYVFPVSVEMNIILAKHQDVFIYNE